MEDHGDDPVKQIETRGTLPPSVYEVRKFVTNIWNNPLVDEKTLAFREQSRAKLVKFFQDNNISFEDFIAIPYGSILWTIDDESDADYMLIVRSFERAIDLRPYNNFLNENKLSVHTAADIDYLINLPDYKTLLSLIITPDEYLIGNTHLAAELRKTGVNNALDPFRRDFAEARMDITFQTGYQNWRDLDHMRPETTRQAHRLRQSRYNAALNKRAAQTHAPERWKAAFEKALHDTWLPDLQVFADCFNFTEGQLRQLSKVA